MVPADRRAHGHPAGWVPGPRYRRAAPSIVVAQTSASIQLYTSIELRMPQPQTVIELLAEDGRALGRATIRYSTGGASARPGPTLCSFRTGRRRRRRSRREPRRGGDTRRRSRAPGDARGAHGAAARDGGTRTHRLSAQPARCAGAALPRRGRLDAFLNAFVEPDMEAMWWLRAAPDVVSAHQPFLRWRGLRPVRGW